MFEKLMHYMLRFEIWMMGFRRDKNVSLVNRLLKEREAEEAIVYSKGFLVMLLYKGETVCFDVCPPFMSEEEIIRHHTEAIKEVMCRPI
jgi:hypothetical protein